MTDPTEPISVEPGSGEASPEPPLVDQATAYTPEPATPPVRSGVPPRARWIVAALVVVLAAGLAAGAGLLLGSRATPEALTYVPADMTLVFELRMDLPGDQLQKVGNLLAHFPGFKDQSSLNQKISESLSKLTARASNGSVDYATQVQPWLAGPLFAGFALDPANPLEPRAVAVATTDGTADCATLFPGGKTAPIGSLTMSTNERGTEGCLRDGRFAILGTPATIQAALDAHSKHSGIDTDTTYRAARDALGGDRLATVYLSGRLYADLPDMLRQLPGASLVPTNPFGRLGTAAFPAWAIYGLSAEDDAIVAETVVGPLRAPSSSGVVAGSPLPSLLTPPPDHASRIAPLVPGDALALFEVHGVGVGIQNVLTVARTAPELQSSFAQIDSMLAALGGTSQLVGWVEDLGVVVVPDGTTATGGLIIVAPDAATATSRVQQLLGFVRLAAGSANVQVRDETIAGVTVTFIEGDFGPLAPGAGGSGTPTSANHVSVAVAVKGPNVYIGSGATFAHTFLELAAGSSLADTAGYKALLQRTSGASSGAFFFAAGRTLDLVEPLIPASEKAAFDTDVKPYLEPFDTVYGAVWRQGDLTRLRVLVIVK